MCAKKSRKRGVRRAQAHHTTAQHSTHTKEADSTRLGSARLTSQLSHPPSSSILSSPAAAAAAAALAIWAKKLCKKLKKQNKMKKRGNELFQKKNSVVVGLCWPPPLHNIHTVAVVFQSAQLIPAAKARYFLLFPILALLLSLFFLPFCPCHWICFRRSFVSAYA